MSMSDDWNTGRIDDSGYANDWQGMNADPFAKRMYDQPTEAYGGQNGSGGGDWIGALIGLGTSIYNANRMKAAQERQNQYNVDAANTKWERELQMWNMMNDYNSPLSQRERYAAAGINANMGFSSGSANAGNASGLPQYNAPTKEFTHFPIDFMGAMSAYQNFQFKRAQIDNVKAQTDATKQKTINDSLRQLLIPAQTEKTKADTGYTQEKKDQLDMLRPYNAAVKQEEARQAPLRTSQMAQQLLNMRQDELIKTLQQDTMKKNMTLQELNAEKAKAEILYKQYENQWRAKGVTSSDNVVLRMVTRLMGDNGFSDYWKGPGSSQYRKPSLNAGNAQMMQY